MSCFVYRLTFATSFVYRVYGLAIHNTFCGSQDIHKLHCDLYIWFQQPQTLFPLFSFDPVAQEGGLR